MQRVALLFCLLSACQPAASGANFSAQSAATCDMSFADGKLYRDAPTRTAYQYFAKPLVWNDSVALCRSFGGLSIYTGQVLPDAIVACQKERFFPVWLPVDKEHTKALEHNLDLDTVVPEGTPTQVGAKEAVICWKAS